jgi:hypothetical protein
VKGVHNPIVLRERAKEDAEFRARLTQFISKITQEVLPEEPVDFEPDASDTSMLFKPFLDINTPLFENAANKEVYYIVSTRQMHSTQHNQSCFKGRACLCRYGFPKHLFEECYMDPDTGVVVLKRNHAWVNSWNFWMSLMTRANHDVRCLMTGIYVIAVVHYVMKYMSKSEITVQSRLVIAQAILAEMREDFKGNKFVTKMANKIDSHGEIGHAQAIAGILSFRDHYTDVVFENVNTTVLLNVIRQLENVDGDSRTENLNDAKIYRDLGRKGGLYAVPMFDDYRFRGTALEPLCLYDYASLVYKKPEREGIPFESPHGQTGKYWQHIREGTPRVPNLIGKLLFIKPDEEDSAMSEDLYRMLSGLFIPWKKEGICKPRQMSWKVFFENERVHIRPRLRRCIENLALLHKTSKEIEHDLLQRKANGISGPSYEEHIIQEGLEDFESGINHIVHGVDVNDLRLTVEYNIEVDEVKKNLGNIESNTRMDLSDSIVFVRFHESEVFGQLEDNLGLDKSRVIQNGSIKRLFMTNV